jgi:hypothetical protein
MNVPTYTKKIKMSQTFAENNNKCCVCYNDNSKEEGKFTSIINSDTDDDDQSDEMLLVVIQTLNKFGVLNNPLTLQPTSIIRDSDTDDDSVEIIYEPHPRPVVPLQQTVSRPVKQRKSKTYARDKLLQNDMLVQTLRKHKMVLRYDRLNEQFIGDDNRVYKTLNKASKSHALEVGLLNTPNAWTTFKRLDGSRIDNL